MDFTKVYVNDETRTALLTRDKYVNSPDVVTTVNTYVTHSKFESFSGTRHPGYFERIKRGELVLGDSIHIVSSSNAGGAGYTNSPTPPQNYNGGWIGKSYEGGGSVTQYLNTLFPATWPTLNVRSSTLLGSDAQIKALAGVTKPDYRMMEDLLTIRQNIKFLKNPFQDLFKTTDDFLKKRDSIVSNNILSRRDPRVLKLLSDLYLGYRFAVTPTVKSLHDLFEGILKHHDGFSKDILLRASGKASSADGGTLNSIGKDVNLLSRANYQATENLTREVRVIIFYRLKHDVSGYAQTYGVRLKDLPAGVWACVPLSFMVDRVMNITNYLNAIANLADPNIKIEGGCFVNSEIRTKQLQLTSMINTSTVIYSGGGDVWTQFSNVKSKTAFIPSFSNLPRPPIQLAGLVSDAKSIADLAALVYQRTRRL